jgi:hypothetical protein
MYPEIRIAAVCERDIDLLLQEEAVASTEFQEWIVRRSGVGLYPCSLISARRSVTQSNGESDLELTFSTDSGEAIRLLLENKVDASFQVKQALRYADRARAYIARGECTVSRTILIAPGQYLGQRGDALGFDVCISYEELIAWYAEVKDAGMRSHYKRRLLSAAIEKSALGYQPIADAPVTDWWRAYWELARRVAPELEMKEPNVKPAGAGFIYFRPLVLPRGVEVCHKLPHGNVDLQFNKWGARLAAFRDAVADVLEAAMTVAPANKSAAVRLKAPEVNTSLPFNDQQQAAKESLTQAVLLLRWYLRNRQVLGARGLDPNLSTDR